MGMNYYLHTKPPCECCKGAYGRLHIGKSSAGWCFALHVIPEEEINDLEDWRVLLSQPWARIEDEYGNPVNADMIECVIANRSWPRTFDQDGRWAQLKGYVTEQHFHQKNHSQRGPNGLLRHAIGNGCVKHGNGTWDCIGGDFS